MTYAKLQYARNLEQEEHALRKQAQAEYQKRVHNVKKQKVLHDTLEEVKGARSSVRLEILEWLNDTDLPSDIKQEVIQYYISGGCFYNDNFFRYVKRALGENK